MNYHNYDGSYVVTSLPVWSLGKFSYLISVLHSIATFNLLHTFHESRSRYAMVITNSLPLGLYYSCNNSAGHSLSADHDSLLSTCSYFSSTPFNSQLQKTMLQLQEISLHLKCTNLAIARRSHPHSLAYSGLAYQGQTCKLQAATGQYRTSALASYFQI